MAIYTIHVHFIMLRLIWSSKYMMHNQRCINTP